jgi:subtilase family serine protease
MRRRIVLTIGLVGLLAGLVSGASGAAASAGLQFVPQVALAPDARPATGQDVACTTPPPVFTYAFFHCYTPADMAAAYGLDQVHSQGLTGVGQTIVIVDSFGSPTALSDLQTFSSTFGLPDPNLTIHYPCGKPKYGKRVHGIQANWAFETSLDLQWAHATAPDAALVLVAANPQESQGVQGFPCMFKGEQWAIQNYPGSVMSQSFAVTEQSFHGAGKAQVARFDKVYQQAVANHVTVFGSSGDTGTANGDKQGRIYQFPTVNWPSSDPLVTSAGGTWLQYGWTWDPSVSAQDFWDCINGGTDFNTCATPYLSWTNGGQTEAVWKEDWDLIATGGGRSVLFPTPSFQSGLPQSLLQGARGLPDLSWNAAVDGGALTYTSFGGVRVGWHTVGGTSASSPQLAGVIALANQLRAQLGKGSIGYLNPVLYTLPSSDFTDTVPQTFGSGAGLTTLDSNELFGSGIPGMETTAGWDLTTGFGSPNVPAFVADLGAAP